MKTIEYERIWMIAIRGEGYYWREIGKRTNKRSRRSAHFEHSITRV